MSHIISSLVSPLRTIVAFHQDITSEPSVFNVAILEGRIVNIIVYRQNLVSLHYANTTVLADRHADLVP